MKTLLRLMIVSLAFFLLMCKTDEGTDPVADDPSKVEGFSPDETIKDGNITVYNYSYLSTGFDATIITVPDTLHYIFIPLNPPKLAVVAQQGSWRYLINASYISGTYADAKHVGWLRIYGLTYEPVSEDKQLTHVVSFSRSTKIIRFIYYKDFVSANDNNSLEFQTGPLVVENNILAGNYINSSLNYWKLVPRTLLASINNNQAYFVIIRNGADLTSIGKFLMKLSIFQGKRLDVVNLDGGPSTALYSKNYSKLNFDNGVESLPVLLGIH